MFGGAAIISGVRAVGAALGYRVWVQRDRPEWDSVLFDRFSLETWYTSSARRSLYEEGLTRTASQASDSLARQARYNSLIQLAELAVRRHPTLAIAECGCFRGHSSFLLASIQRRAQATGTFHIFDSFEGLSIPTTEDADPRRRFSAEETAQLRQSFAARQADVAQVLAPFPQVRLHPGWIPERFGDVRTETFGFVHVDVDLYEPTRDSVDFFWPRLASGGILCCDDYGLTQFPGAKRALDLWRDQAGFFLELPLGGCFLVKP